MLSLGTEKNSKDKKTARTLERWITDYNSQISNKTKRLMNQFQAWSFRFTIQIDLLGEERVYTDEKKLLPNETSDEKISSGSWSASSCLFRHYILRFLIGLCPCTRYNFNHTSPLISVLIVGFAQCTLWPAGSWTLNGRQGRLRVRRAGSLGLNNNGYLSASENRQVFRQLLRPHWAPPVGGGRKSAFKGFRWEKWKD